jgi:hypothetical protein
MQIFNDYVICEKFNLPWDVYKRQPTQIMEYFGVIIDAENKKQAQESLKAEMNAKTAQARSNNLRR